ncbi:WAS/WASL-interacting protein family member 3 [Orycteropus afer afer]|uniref:WAS/WASL-interacting protein family member 3 n=1 Tax=Orycteropus afer afer TaxID=1230840 RepID=A0A8B7A9I4_ORYAF|nr:WAS/WASL-interacting protein family member 3 [Orycteropus afer afer]
MNSRGALRIWDPPSGFQSDPARLGHVPELEAVAEAPWQEPAEQVGAAAPPPRPGSTRAGGRGASGAHRAQHRAQRGGSGATSSTGAAGRSPKLEPGGSGGEDLVYSPSLVRPPIAGSTLPVRSGPASCSCLGRAERDREGNEVTARLPSDFPGRDSPVSTDISSLRKADPKGRSALLADIQQGTRLRKVTQINDRSAPQIENSKGTNKEGGGSANSRGGSTPPALGDLFAGGFPVLRPAGQRDAAVKPQLTPLHLPPIPPPLPLLPPCGYPGLNADAGSPTQDVREPPAPPAPPPPPPLPSPHPIYASCSPRSSVPTPPLPGANNSSDVPPPLPPKSPSFQAQPQKPSVQALPTPPAPPGPQFLQKKRHGRGPGTSGGKLNPPPAPPARSPTTELSSKSQQAPAWIPTQQPGGQLRNGNLHIMDDFESKFTFHSEEDFPPPDEYKPCQKIYPSKIPRSRTPGPWLQTETGGQGSDDIKGRNSQVTCLSGL